LLQRQTISSGSMIAVLSVLSVNGSGQSLASHALQTAGTGFLIALICGVAPLMATLACARSS
jgi:hypothetical protein